MSEFSHLPVMLGECVAGLNIKPDGTYLDCTLGGGGHSSEICKNLLGGRLIGIDRDSDAIAAAESRIRAAASGRCEATAVRGNFHDAKALLAELGVYKIDGALMDLGVSSHQLDSAPRGFSYKADAPLDMRMDMRQSLTAAEIMNEWSEDDITRVISEYGEEKWARQIARVACDRRKISPIDTTFKLVGIIDASIPKKFRAKDGSHPARRTFQALRIAVNDELTPLKNAVYDIADMLNPGGRICVLTFHSLEDRIIKTAFNALENPCTCPKSFPICVCGKKPTLKAVTGKPLKASAAELSENPRSRSASLRIAEKL